MVNTLIRHKFLVKGCVTLHKGMKNILYCQDLTLLQGKIIFLFY